MITLIARFRCLSSLYLVVDTRSGTNHGSRENFTVECHLATSLAWESSWEAVVAAVLWRSYKCLDISLFAGCIRDCLPLFLRDFQLQADTILFMFCSFALQCSSRVAISNVDSHRVDWARHGVLGGSDHAIGKSWLSQWILQQPWPYTINFECCCWWSALSLLVFHCNFLFASYATGRTRRCVDGLFWYSVLFLLIFMFSGGKPPVSNYKPKDAQRLLLD